MRQSAKRSVAAEVMSLAKGSATYLLPMVLTQGLSFLMAPVYTRYMTAADYGIVGIASTLTPLMALALGLSTQSAALRLYHAAATDEARARLIGNILGFMLVISVGLGVLVELVGFFRLVEPFDSVPYSPYLRLIVWAGIATLPIGLTRNILVVREQHRAASLLNAVLVLSTIAMTVSMVVVARRGAEGHLTAILVANGVVALWSVFYVWRSCRPRLDRDALREILSFSVPLVPHQLSKWALAASDRIILERWVTNADLGRYALGYSAGSAVGMFLTAVNTALFPILSRRLLDPGGVLAAPVIGSVAIAATTLAAVVVSTVLPPLLVLLTPAEYHGSAAVVPLVAAGFYFQALYLVWSQGLYLAKRTGLVATLTVAGAAVNIGLNLLLVPIWGIMAAASTTAIGYAFMAFLNGYFARGIEPRIAWEYGRAARIGLAAAAAYGASRLLPDTTPVSAILVGCAVSFCLFPMLLFATGAMTSAEVGLVRELVSGRLARKNTK
jgi:O-antigen/teichoic acid export membrane protein